MTSLSQRSGNRAGRIQLHVSWDREVDPILLDLHVVGLCLSMLLWGLVVWIPDCHEGFGKPLGCCLPTFIQKCMEVGNWLVAVGGGEGPSQEEMGFISRKKTEG